MFCLDTSFVVSLFVPDAHSARALRWLGGQSAGELSISAWVRLEFAGVLARQVRMGRLTTRAADSAIEDFGSWSSSACELIVPASADFDAAVELVRRYVSAMRAPDALHLAIVANWGARRLVTFDADMAAAAKTIGIKSETI